MSFQPTVSKHRGKLKALPTHQENYPLALSFPDPPAGSTGEGGRVIWTASSFSGYTQAYTSLWWPFSGWIWTSVFFRRLLRVFFSGQVPNQQCRSFEVNTPQGRRLHRRIQDVGGASSGRLRDGSPPVSSRKKPWYRDVGQIWGKRGFGQMI